MNVKEAVVVAKAHVADLFGEEGPTNIGLEEVEFDSSDNTWTVTVGFSRPWDEPKNAFAVVAGSPPRRTYKVVVISNSNKEVVSVKNRGTDA